MRLRPRLTVRWMMYAVAVVALSIAAYFRFLELRAQYAALAIAYAKNGLMHDIYYWMYEAQSNRLSAGLGLSGREVYRDRLPLARRGADYHRAMRDKYAEASKRPWLPVASDPPPPDIPLFLDRDL